MTTDPTMPKNGSKVGVQTTYTELQVIAFIKARRDEKWSLRKIAKMYGNDITHADIERILKDGKFPVGLKKRMSLKVPPVCPKCEQPLPKPGKRVSAILNLDPDCNLKYTRSRNERLDEIAKAEGYDSWCNYSTAVLHRGMILRNGE
jgi:hypothetical protein